MAKLGRPKATLTVRKAKTMLNRRSRKWVKQLERLIDKAEESGDLKTAMTGVIAALKKCIPDAQPVEKKTASGLDANAQLAADAQRILGEFMAQHGIVETPESH